MNVQGKSLTKSRIESTPNASLNLTPNVYAGWSSPPFHPSKASNGLGGLDPGLWFSIVQRKLGTVIWIHNKTVTGKGYARVHMHVCVRVYVCISLPCSACRQIFYTLMWPFNLAYHFVHTHTCACTHTHTCACVYLYLYIPAKVHSRRQNHQYLKQHKINLQPNSYWSK